MSEQTAHTANDKCNLKCKAVAFTAALLLAGGLMAGSAQATEYETEADLFDMPLNKATMLGLYLTSVEGYRFKTENPKILFIDVRTRAEVNFLGMPDVADANIPIKPFTTILSNSGKVYQRVDNKDFVPAVADLIERKGLDPDPVIFIMCRNGKGSAIAANLLANHGYNKVYSIIDGYEGDIDSNGKRTVNGWRNAGLPWSYGIGKDRAYSYTPGLKHKMASF